MVRKSVSRLKGTELKFCENPKCNNLFWGYSNQKYCSKKCRIQASNLRNK